MLNVRQTKITNNQNVTEKSSKNDAEIVFNKNVFQEWTANIPIKLFRNVLWTFKMSSFLNVWKLLDKLQ